jgi:outer membrane protein OmpA-like peptidoglycan-associated protein
MAIYSSGLKSRLVIKPVVFAIVVCFTTSSAIAQAQQAGQSSKSDSSDDPCASNRSAVIGSVTGAVIGGVLGSLLGGKKKNTNIALGVAVGAVAGGLIGHNMDARRCEISKLSQQYGMPVEFAAIHPESTEASVEGAGSVSRAETGGQESPTAKKSFADSFGMTIAVQDLGQQFSTGSALLEPKAFEYFGKVADQYSYAKQFSSLKPSAKQSDRADVEGLKFKRILLIGHTDDTGSSALNAELSEQRAKAVAEVFRASGVSDGQLFYQGAGETLPVADNHTEEGRARNRRVEIIDLTDEASFRKYLEQRAPKTAYYRPAPAAAKVPSAAPISAAIASQPQAAVSMATKPGASIPGTKAHLGPQTAHSSARSAPFDFGGEPVKAANSDVNVGAIIPDRSSPSPVSTAYAAMTPLGSCYNDRPRVAHGVKSLRDQREVSISEYMPGLYGTSWTDTVNGNLVAITNVSVYRDGGQPAAQPTVLVYKDYVNGMNAKPDLKAVAQVNTYRGEKGLLYRLFVNGPVQCMDVVLPYTNTKQAFDSRLLYQRMDETFVANFKPHMAK